jgi:hypothetical protein
VGRAVVQWFIHQKRLSHSCCPREEEIPCVRPTRLLAFSSNTLGNPCLWSYLPRSLPTHALFLNTTNPFVTKGGYIMRLQLAVLLLQTLSCEVWSYRIKVVVRPAFFPVLGATVTMRLPQSLRLPLVPFSAYPPYLLIDSRSYVRWFQITILCGMPMFCRLGSFDGKIIIRFASLSRTNGARQHSRVPEHVRQRRRDLKPFLTHTPVHEPNTTRVSPHESIRSGPYTAGEYSIFIVCSPSGTRHALKQ